MASTAPARCTGVIHIKKTFFRHLLILLLGALSSISHAGNGSRFLATGAVTTLDGTAGGGIVPMAVLAGYSDREQQGGSAFVSRTKTDDYSLVAYGAAWNWRNRIELSIARQTLDLSTLDQKLSLGHDTFQQTVYGAKARIAGDVLYTRIPQLSIGIQHRRQHDFDIPSLVGARDDTDTEVYLSATKVFLAALAGRNVIVNGAVRSTRANQAGLIGFGGDLRATQTVVAEGSLGVFLNRHLLLGGEYRQMPDNLSFARQDDWKDIFIAWFPDRQWSVTAAHVDLGSIATLTDQRGWYLSVEGTF